MTFTAESCRCRRQIAGYCEVRLTQSSVSMRRGLLVVLFGKTVVYLAMRWSGMMRAAKVIHQCTSKLHGAARRVYFPNSKAKSAEFSGFIFQPSILTESIPWYMPWATFGTASERRSAWGHPNSPGRPGTCSGYRWPPQSPESPRPSSNEAGGEFG